MSFCSFLSCILFVCSRLLFSYTESVFLYRFYRKHIEDYNPVATRAGSLGGKDAIEVNSAMYYHVSTGLLYKWKFWASLCLSACAMGLSIFTVLLHFDTIFFPKLWLSVFRDGSIAERNWILFLLLIWIVTLYATTSVLSVGEYQANAFFTAWISAAATFMTFGVWRESAGLVSLTENAINGLRRQTTYNWMWTFVFSFVFAVSSTDIYINRAQVELKFQGEALDVENDTWTNVLVIVWSDVLVCILVIAFNEIFVASWQFPCQIRRSTGIYHFVFGWRQLEVLIILIMMGLKFYGILEYTGVEGVINGLSNAYFGIWGSFFNSVFSFGTWLRENMETKNVFVREEKGSAPEPTKAMEMERDDEEVAADQQS